NREFAPSGVDAAPEPGIGKFLKEFIGHSFHFRCKAARLATVADWEGKFLAIDIPDYDSLGVRVFQGGHRSIGPIEKPGLELCTPAWGRDVAGWLVPPVPGITRIGRYLLSVVRQNHQSDRPAIGPIQRRWKFARYPLEKIAQNHFGRFTLFQETKSQGNVFAASPR